MANSKNPSKEVAKKTHAGGSVEESFGAAPPVISVGGGRMHKFGHKIHKEVWPTMAHTHSVNVKTGFPEGYDKPIKGTKP
jgi:hypothetical protein